MAIEPQKSFTDNNIEKFLLKVNYFRKDNRNRLFLTERGNNLSNLIKKIKNEEKTRTIDDIRDILENELSFKGIHHYSESSKR